MLFPTATFALFFLVVLPLSWLTMPWPHRWRPFIIVASYVFYSWWDWRFVLLLAGCTLWNQLLAVRIWRSTLTSQKRALLILALAGDLGVLGYFKYYDFFVSSTDNLATYVGMDLPFSLKTIVLPVGISFFTFMAISYVVDAYRGEFQPTTLEKFAVYLSFFPHLVAGPIVRPGELIPQIETPRDPRRVDTSRAFYLIATGLFKKVVIANYLASSIVDQVFATPGQHSSLEILIAVYAYAVQIYADFSGYTDIAIGIALLLGFTFPQNFDSPYAAVSVQDFWRRWHMTLSRWLRDYLYIPLGGNRGNELFTYRNLMLTMLLGGLWHGAAWNFVIWGGIHGTGLAIERYVASRRHALGHAPRADTVWRRAVGRFVTFHVVCLAWVFFRADGLSSAMAVLGRLLSFAGGGFVAANVLLLVVVGILIQYLPKDASGRLQRGFSSLGVGAQAAVLATVLVAVSTFGNQGVAAFIYFRF